ncbi:uncharacterized protein LOC144129960 [Amblyomma americanum]
MKAPAPKPAQDARRPDALRKSRRAAGRRRSKGGSRASCSGSDSLSLAGANEASFIKQSPPKNTRIKVCHKRTQLSACPEPKVPDEPSKSQDPYEYSEEIVVQEPKTSAPGGGAAIRVANKGVQAACIVCEPLPQVVPPVHIVVEGVEPVRKSSLRSSSSPDSTGTTSSSKKSVSFYLRSYRRIPRPVYCITIIVLGVVVISPVIYLAVTTKGAQVADTAEATTTPQAITELNVSGCKYFGYNTGFLSPSFVRSFYF